VFRRAVSTSRSPRSGRAPDWILVLGRDHHGQVTGRGRVVAGGHSPAGHIRSFVDLAVAGDHGRKTRDDRPAAWRMPSARPMPIGQAVGRAPPRRRLDAGDLCQLSGCRRGSSRSGRNPSNVSTGKNPLSARHHVLRARQPWPFAEGCSGRARPQVRGRRRDTRGISFVENRMIFDQRRSTSRYGRGRRLRAPALRAAGDGSSVRRGGVGRVPRRCPNGVSGSRYGKLPTRRFKSIPAMPRHAGNLPLLCLPPFKLGASVNTGCPPAPAKKLV